MREEIIELKPIEESPFAYDQIEARLKKFFRERIYLPLLRQIQLPQKTIQNAAHPNALMDALFTGRVIYSNGGFSGKFNASISQELRALGASFDRRTGSYRLPEGDLPSEMKAVIGASQAKFQEKMIQVDEHLAKIMPEELAQQFKCADIFDQTLYKADKNFQKNVKNITVSPPLTVDQRQRVADEWQNNMKLWIKDWTVDQIKTLRAKIFEDVMSGMRREGHIPPILKITKTIQESHEQAMNKAKFLAHQETRLLMAKFKEVRYTDSGIHEYIWRTVHRPKDADPLHHTPGNVRYSHGILDGKVFRWDNPPVTTHAGEPVRKNNPGQDYRCRCAARPILRKK